MVVPDMQPKGIDNKRERKSSEDFMIFCLPEKRYLPEFDQYHGVHGLTPHPSAPLHGHGLCADCTVWLAINLIMERNFSRRMSPMIGADACPEIAIGMP